MSRQKSPLLEFAKKENILFSRISKSTNLRDIESPNFRPGRAARAGRRPESLPEALKSKRAPRLRNGYIRGEIWTRLAVLRRGLSTSRVRQQPDPDQTLQNIDFWTSSWHLVPKAGAPKYDRGQQKRPGEPFEGSKRKTSAALKQILPSAKRMRRGRRFHDDEFF